MQAEIHACYDKYTTKKEKQGKERILAGTASCSSQKSILLSLLFDVLDGIQYIGISKSLFKTPDGVTGRNVGQTS